MAQDELFARTGTREKCPGCDGRVWLLAQESVRDGRVVKETYVCAGCDAELKVEDA